MTESILPIKSDLFVIPVHELSNLLFPLGVAADTKWSRDRNGGTTFRLAQERTGSGLTLQVWDGQCRHGYDRYNPVCGGEELCTSIILPTSPNHRFTYELMWWHAVPADKAKGKFPVRGYPIRVFKDGTLVRTPEFRALRAEANLLREWGVL